MTWVAIYAATGTTFMPKLKIIKTLLWKNFLYFLKKSFSYVSGKWDAYISRNGAFTPKLEKIKEIHPEKIYVLGNGTLLPLPPPK